MPLPADITLQPWLLHPNLATEKGANLPTGLHFLGPLLTNPRGRGREVITPGPGGEGGLAEGQALAVTRSQLPICLDFQLRPILSRI